MLMSIFSLVMNVTIAVATKMLINRMAQYQHTIAELKDESANDDIVIDDVCKSYYALRLQALDAGLQIPASPTYDDNSPICSSIMEP